MNKVDNLYSQVNIVITLSHLELWNDGNLISIGKDPSLVSICAVMRVEFGKSFGL